NPPIVSYYIALAAYLFGWSEVSLHLAFLVPACGVVIGTWLLAKDFCSRPFFASLSVICTPVFLVSATTLMCDVLMLAFWIFAVIFWRRGIKTDNMMQIAYASVLIVLAILTKFSAVCLIPLLLAYSLLEKRKISFWILFLFFPIVVLGIYEWVTYSFYGTGHLTYIHSFTESAKQIRQYKYVSGITTGISFVGGCILFPVFYIFVFHKKFKIIIGFAIVVLLLIWLMSFGALVDYPIADADGVNWSFAVQLSVFVFSGACFFYFVLKSFIQKRDSDSFLIFLWVVGVFTFSTVINWSVNGRSILPIVPVAGIFVIRHFEQLESDLFVANFTRLYVPLILTLLIGLTVSFADYKWALVSRNAAIRLSSDYRKNPGNLWYEGHWGFQYYMSTFGRGKPLDYEKPLLIKGDLIIVPSFNSNTKPIFKSTACYMQELCFDVPGPISTMNMKYGAGFYADLAGPLPFAFGPPMLEKYYVYKMIINKKSKFNY
ncbi:MAG TPA: hypothetical protein DIW31_08800, partial [Bacteroidales bacterium]|nr:hypothetical protein [Bacteroidales bacterium]